MPLKDMLQQLLVRFRKANGNQLPSAVLLYRDGVGQSQILGGSPSPSCRGPRIHTHIHTHVGIAAVRQHELPELREVLGDIPLCIVLATKRHHTRLFKDLGNNRVDNPSAGTLLDTDIVRRHSFLFVSHAPALGTSHPTLYQASVLPHWRLRAKLTRDSRRCWRTRRT